MNLLINANAKSIPLADGSVNCVVTSPPYYGLRDYGTAKWIGGDPKCDHTVGSGDNDNLKTYVTRPERDGIKRQYCQKCGAVRIDQQIGLEQTPAEYVDNIVQVFREVRRVLRDDGTVWLNLGDSYAGNMSRASNGGRAGYGTPREGIFNRGGDGIKDKDLIGIPWMVAFALRDDGWYLRQDIIWAKPNPMPESVKDRCTKAHEYVFLLTKSARYYYDYEAVLEPATGFDGRKDTKMKGSDKYANGSVPNQQPQTVAVKGHERWTHTLTTGATGEPHSGYLNPDGSLRVHLKDGVPARNKRSVWTVSTKPYKGAHFATFPPKLIEPMILAGCPKGGVVLDPFVGSGTTVMVANQLGRQGIGIDLNPKYLKLAQERVKEVQPILI